MSDEYSFEGLGYRLDLENKEELLAGADATFHNALTGDMDIKGLGSPMGLVDILVRHNQARMNSCAGNSVCTVQEGCIYHQSGGLAKVQLSRMFAYVNGQHYANIQGDRGATLGGVLKGLKTDGCPREELAPYTGTYYTRFSDEARRDAPNNKLLSYSPITDVDQVYEGLAKKIGGAYFGMCWNGEFRDPKAGGFVDRYQEVSGCGFHAVTFMDWCDERDEKGYPRLRLFNSHGMQYGDRGTSLWSRDAVQAAIHSPNTTCYFLSDMQFMKPRFDFKKIHWTDTE